MFNCVLINSVLISSFRKNHKEMFYKHLRKVRETKEGAELKAELQKLTLWIDEDPKLFTADIIYNILLSYRDIQVSDWEIHLLSLSLSHSSFSPLSLSLLSPPPPPSPQDYDSMIKLVDKIEGHEEAQKPTVQVQCAFALNRRNKKGDRDRALTILEKVCVCIYIYMMPVQESRDK